jgi:hypothetical protein
VMRILFAAFGLALLLTSFARAQAPAPLDLVRSFYAPGFEEEKMPLSARLQRLLDAAVANSKKHNAPVTGLDFSWILNAQDAEPGFDKTLSFSETKRSAAEAIIRVTFKNGRDEELRYDLKRENGKMVVDDIHYLSGQPTSLSHMLTEGAKEQP